MACARDLYQSFDAYVNGGLDFDELAMAIFHCQARENRIYNSYLSALGVDIELIKEPKDMIYLPISFFKSHKVVTGDFQVDQVFESSSTTGINTSKHHIDSIPHYHKNALQIFKSQIGEPEDYAILALLPSYLERPSSSLVSMVNYLMECSGHLNNQSYLHDHNALLENIANIRSNNMEVVLFGVRYALLDLAEQNEADLSNVTIIETGGMKGRRGFVSNHEFKSILHHKLKPKSIRSEYGMTELLSQAYSDIDFRFTPANTMRIHISDLNDPFAPVPMGKTGRINVIDLANISSCSFIATDDLGRKIDDDRFEVLGRADHAEQRGCNLLIGDVSS